MTESWGNCVLFADGYISGSPSLDKDHGPPVLQMHYTENDNDTAKRHGTDRRLNAQLVSGVSHGWVMEAIDKSSMESRVRSQMKQEIHLKETGVYCVPLGDRHAW